MLSEEEKLQPLLWCTFGVLLTAGNFVNRSKYLIFYLGIPNKAVLQLWSERTRIKLHRCTTGIKITDL